MVLHILLMIGINANNSVISFIAINTNIYLYQCIIGLP